MARKTELTQEIINETAEELHSKGVKPSPNNVREVLGTGSYSTIKQMLDVWKERQKEDENVFIPDTPDFAYRIVDKLHKELYLQNRKQLDSERQQLDLSRQEMEVEKSEMLLEINNLEESSKSLKGELTKKDDELTRLNTDLNSSQGRLENLLSESNEQKIKIATLSERDKQQTLQLKEKDLMLKQAEEQEQSLVKKMEADKTEISQLGVSIEKLNGELSQRGGELDKKDKELAKSRTDTEKSQEKVENITEKFNVQKNDLAILTEREKQQALQLKEKDTLLKQAEKQQGALTKQIEELMKKLEK